MSSLRAGSSWAHLLLLGSWETPAASRGEPRHGLPCAQGPCGSVQCDTAGLSDLAGMWSSSHSQPAHTPSRRPRLCKGPPQAVPCHERKNSYRSGASQRWGPARVGLQQNWGSGKTQPRCCDMLGQRQSPGAQEKIKQKRPFPEALGGRSGSFGPSSGPYWLPRTRSTAAASEGPPSPSTPVGAQRPHSIETCIE